MLKNLGLISRQNFLSIDIKTGETEVIWLRLLVQVAFPEGYHAAHTTKINRARTCHIEGILINSGQRKTIVFVVVSKGLVLDVEYRKALIGDEKQFVIAQGRGCNGINTAACKPFVPTVIDETVVAFVVKVNAIVGS